jgi:hypothetical protein
MKYAQLEQWLSRQAKGDIVVTFSEIEVLLGFSLPSSARKFRQWWENDVGHAQAKAWLNAGFVTRDVVLVKEILVFSKA